MELLAAFIGASAGLLAGFFAGRRASRLEYEKESRQAVTQVARGIGAATHTLAWLTWRAKYQPEHLTVEHVDSFDNDMHSLYPELTGSLALVAALNRPAYLRLQKIVDEVYSLDDKVAQATSLVRDGAEKAAASLAMLYEPASALERQLMDRLSGVMALISRKQVEP